jgi:DNA polymerase I-like protein with 3'-5' exonuclease and polymerase domains
MVSTHKLAGCNGYQRGLYIAGYRAITTLHATSALHTSLHLNQLWDIYHHIELPLLYSVADLEYHGMQVDNNMLSAMRKGLADRCQVIEHYFNAMLGASQPLSLDSGKDVKKVKDDLIQMALTVIQEQQQASTQHSNPLSMTRATSDWSAGKERVIQDVSSQALQLAKRHPLWKMISEYHSHSQVLPTINGALSCRRFDRVRPFYATLGTETGRVIATQPPLQQVITLLVL